MKAYYVLLTLILFSLGLFSQNPDGFDKMTDKMVKSDVPIVDSKRLKYLMSQDVYVLDTREQNEFNTSHINGAEFVGYQLFKMKQVEHIPKDAIIVTYCSVGYRSGKIGEKLISEGYENVYNLIGGIFDWTNNHNEIVNEKGEKTNVVHGYNKKWSKWVNPKIAEVTID